MDKRKRIVNDHYKPLLARYQQGYEILDWESRESQLGRFEVLLNNVELRGKKLLDIGCGTGDLYGIIRDRYPDIEYYGIDILPEMRDRALKFYPEGRFFAGDIFRDNIFKKKQFNAVFCSGIFNLNMGDNEAFLKAALPVFFNLAKEKVVFNLLDPGHYAMGSKYFFFHQKDVLHWIRTYTDKVRIVTGYVPNDFTVIAETE